MSITRADVGAWVVKGNPKWWGYYEKRAAQRKGPGDRVIDTDWSLGGTSRNELIQPGDLIALYMGNPAGELVEIGIANGLRGETKWDPDYVKNLAEGEKRREFLGYDGVILSTPIPREGLKANPAIGKSEFIRAPKMSNPTYLTPEATVALAAMISPNDLRRAKWVSHPVITRGR